MKPKRPPPAPASREDRQPATLRARLAEAEATLRAIRSGEVDAVVVAGKGGPRVFTLEGADHAYRVLIESMHEGALTLTVDAAILYANQRFARMVRCPLERVTGGSLYRFVVAEDQASLRPLLQRPQRAGSKIQVLLKAGSSKMPVQIAIRPLARNGANRATIGLVVTDMTEARRTEERLRALTHRVVEVQEAERGRLALELHDNVTQLLCAVLIRTETLAAKLPGSDGPTKREVMKLRDLLGRTVGEAERISRDLRPSVLTQLGLAAVLNEACTEFTKRTGVSVKLVFAEATHRLPVDIELALYRILQKALRNVECYARASRVTVRFLQRRSFVRLTVTDDGVGFDPERQPGRRKRAGGPGLLSMVERAASLGGALEVTSARGAGTKLEIRIPLSP